MKILPRMARHLFTTIAAGRRAFPPPALKAIQAAIAAGEALHRAEIRIIIEPALSLQAVLLGTSARERARELFSRYRIWDTEENCGVLIYLNLADHKVEIVADRSVNRAIDAHAWQSVCRTITEGFAHGTFPDSVIAAFGQLNVLLKAHLPATRAHRNKLSKRPTIL